MVDSLEKITLEINLDKDVCPYVGKSYITDEYLSPSFPEIRETCIDRSDENVEDYNLPSHVYL
jgi:hypothetical protein